MNVIRNSIYFQSILILLVVLGCSSYLYTTDDKLNSTDSQNFAACGSSIEYLSDKYKGFDSTFLINKKDAQDFIVNKIPLIEEYFYRNINIIKNDTVGISIEYQSDTSFVTSYINHVKDSNVVRKIIDSVINASQSLDSSIIYSLCVELSVIRNNAAAKVYVDDINYSTVIGRSKKSIMRTVMKTLPKMRIEYNHILRQYQGVRGKMIVKFIIDESGKVIYLKVIESTLNNCRMENEQINIIKECLFDNDNKPNLTTVVYPFVFSQ